MKTFTFFWYSGKVEVMKGITYQDAMLRAGYSWNELNKIEFYATGDVKDKYAYFKNFGWAKITI